MALAITAAAWIAEIAVRNEITASERNRQRAEELYQNKLVSINPTPKSDLTQENAIAAETQDLNRIEKLNKKEITEATERWEQQLTETHFHEVRLHAKEVALFVIAIGVLAVFLLSFLWK